MNELQSIVDAYTNVRARGERAALATVVAVEGSAYRRPGARMLITESGRTIGAISGGCLERDVAERARQVIKTGAARIVEYDTRGDEDIVWGLGLGCNGVVRVLLESLHEESEALHEGSEGLHEGECLHASERLHKEGDAARSLAFIAELLRTRKGSVIATVIGTEQATEPQAHDAVRKGSSAGHRERGEGHSIDIEAGRRIEIGTRLLFGGSDEQESGESGESFIGGSFVGALDSFDELCADELGARVREDARAALACGRASTRVYETGVGRVEIFFDVIRRPRPLVVFGAEQDAVPVVRLAQTLGWHVTVVDTRAREATRERFPEADAVVLCRAEEVAASVTVARDTAAVLMTHNYLDDVELLRALLPSPACYVGLLGPKKRTQKLLEEVRAGGDALTASGVGFTASQLARLHGPVGVDIGAETPEEIALSVVAEIKAACEGRHAGFLRDREAPIHDDGEAANAKAEFRLDTHRALLVGAAGVACGSS